MTLRAAGVAPPMVSGGRGGYTVPAAPAPIVASEPLPDSDAWTPETVVEWVHRKHGEEGLKLKDWAGMLPGISHRELVRAAGDGRLVCHYKSSGKDHGARMASPDAMRAFLATLEVGSAA